MIKVKRLGGPQTIEIETHSVGLSAVLFHLEKLPQIKVQSKFSYIPTDDCWADFTYKGHQFSINSPFSFIWIHGKDGNVPEPIFEEIESHIRQLKPWNIFEWPARIAYLFKYLVKPIPK